MKKILLVLGVLTLAPVLSAKVVISENFDSFGGSEADKVEVPSLDELTHTPGWTGAEVSQAGGCAYIANGGQLMTPALDLSANGGNYTVSFRAKSTAPVYFYVSDALMSSYKIDAITDEWAEYSIAMTNGGVSTNVILMGYLCDMYIDDIVIDNGGVSIPVALPSTNFTRESFTANWEAADGAESYVLNVFTLDYDVSTTVFSRRYIVENKEVKGTSYEVTEGQYDVPYYYTVSGKTGDAVSEPSDVVRVKPESVSRPTSLSATNITAGSFTANWEESDVASKYYVHVLKQHTAKNAETFTVFDIDFSEIITNGTIDNPQRELEGELETGWTVKMPVYAAGMVGIFNHSDQEMFGQAFMQSPVLDLSKCGGSVTVSFDALSRMGLEKAKVELANIDSSVAFADVKEFEVTEESSHYEFTLAGGTKLSRVVITSEDLGQMFIDNLKVTVELPAGVTFVVPMRVLATKECSADVDRISADDEDLVAYYVIGAWSVRIQEGSVRQIPEVLSDASELFTVVRPAGVDNVIADGDADAQVEYYNLQGIRIDRPDRGIYIERRGTAVKKVAL